MRRVDRDLLVVDPEPGPVRVGVGEPPRQQHLVRRQRDARHQVVRLERGLLDLGVVVGDVAVQGHGAHVDQRVVAVRPDLGQVERVEPVGLGVLERHDLDLERPGRVVPALDVLIQVPLVVVGVHRGHLVGLVLGEELDALVGLEVVLDPVPLPGRVHPHVGVGGVAVHVPPGARDAAVAHQPGHLVSRLRGQGPEVPLHVVVTQVVVGAPLLGPDEMLELHGVADEEDRGVVPDHVVVALGRVELERESARVAPGVGAAPLPGHGGEPGHHIGAHPRLEQRRLGVPADVAGGLEVAERAAALGVRLPLRDPLPVEVGHLLDQIVVLEQDGTVRAYRQRMFIALDRGSGIGGGRVNLVMGHCCSPPVLVLAFSFPACAACNSRAGLNPVGSA